MDILTVATGWYLLGVFTGAIAYHRGHSFGSWFVGGLLLFPLALPLALSPDKDWKRLELRQFGQGFKPCPYCAEMVKPLAVLCRYCGSELEPQETTPKARRSRG